MYTFFKKTASYWNTAVSIMGFSDKLHEAVKQGDKHRVKALLDAGLYLATV